MVSALYRCLVGATAFLLLAELMLHALPVSTSTSTGYYIDPLILTYPPRHHWTVATGWDLRNIQHNRSNNVGFLAKRDFERKPAAVALIGDSYIEASMLDATDRPGPQLERALHGRPVFEMGAPGTALLDYAERIRFASANFDVQNFVLFLERGDIEQSLCGSGNIHGPCLDRRTLAPRTETISPPSLAKRIFRHSALAQYVFAQLKLAPDRIWQRAVAQSRPEKGTMQASGTSPVATPPTPGLSDARRTAHNAVVAAFFDRIKGRVGGKLVLVLDSDRPALYRGQSTHDPFRQDFIVAAQEAGALVIDTEPLFNAAWTASPLKFDVGPYDGHMNALGVRIVMQAAADALQTP